MPNNTEEIVSCVFRRFISASSYECVPFLIRRFANTYRYKIARYRMKHGKQQYSDQDMKRRKLWLIISAVVFGVIALIVLSFIVLLMMAVAFM